MFYHCVCGLTSIPDLKPLSTPNQNNRLNDRRLKIELKKHSLIKVTAWVFTVTHVKPLMCFCVLTSVPAKKKRERRTILVLKCHFVRHEVPLSSSWICSKLIFKVLGFVFCPCIQMLLQDLEKKPNPAVEVSLLLLLSCQRRYVVWIIVHRKQFRVVPFFRPALSSASSPCDSLIWFRTLGWSDLKSLTQPESNQVPGFRSCRAPPWSTAWMHTDKSQ